MKARRIILNAICFILGLLLFGSASHVFSQDAISSALGQLNSSNVRGYVQPIVDGFGANLNSGLYHTPGLQNDGLHARLELVGSGTLVGEPQKYYYATPPAPFDGEPVRTATILGGVGTTVTGPGGVEYQFQNGQIRADLFGLGAPQLTVGNLFGTEAIVRYAVAPSVKDIPRSSLVGYGLRHSVSRYFPMLPVEVSVGAFRQELKVGDIIGVQSTNVALIIGKTVSFFNLFGGVQYESTDIDVHYTYTGYGATPDTKVDLRYSEGGNFRWTTGFGLNLVGLKLSTDIGFGNVTSVTGTVGVGF
jgi:hypothetical protein